LDVDTWHPHTINKGSGQVTLPAKVLKAVGVEQGDEVYVGVNPDDRRTIVIVPAVLLENWIRKGRSADGGIDPMGGAPAT
jgi:hypothetical protein